MSALRFAVALLAYLLFFAAFLYLVGFVGNLLVPRSVDSIPGSPASLPVAAIVNLALIALFGLQHSLMARPRFKRAMSGGVPKAFQRTVYVLASVAALVAMFAFWQPIPQVVWRVENPTAAAILWALFAIGWTIVFISTWLINHFELFGLQQTWHDMRGVPVPEQKFRQPLFYRFSRHPLYAGFLIAFWAIPVMTVGHLLFALGMTAYVLIAIRHEERDLTDLLGDAYADYRTRVGMLVPGLGKART